MSSHRNVYQAKHNLGRSEIGGVEFLLCDVTKDMIERDTIDITPLHSVQLHSTFRHSQLDHLVDAIDATVNTTP